MAAVSIFSLCGMAYSGYLTYYTLTSGSSACELYYFGLPSCFYGLVLYSLVFVPSLSLWMSDRTGKTTISLLALSVAGVGFSGVLTGYIISLHRCLAAPLTIFGIPPCMLGLAMFSAVFCIATSSLFSARSQSRVELERLQTH